MNRRKAIGGMLLAGIGGVLAYSGYKWYNWHKTPDLAYVQKNASLLAALTETILPATDTPGAKAAAVDQFIVIMLRDCVDERTANTFIDGLKDVQSRSFSEYGKPFEQCAAEEQQSIVTYFQEKGKPWGGIAGKIEKRYLGKSFFNILKDLTVEGYCTSKVGATQALSYLYIPGSYQGCMPMQPGQTAWATN